MRDPRYPIGQHDTRAPVSAEQVRRAMRDIRHHMAHIVQAGR